MDADVVIVGAGLAGLQCARALTAAGRTVVVLEAGHSAGGRVRTDQVNGFRCDRGFQVLNPAYPAVTRLLDVNGLGLQPFGAGLLVRAGDGLRVVADPLRNRKLAVGTIRSGLLRPGELAAFARWLGPFLVDAQRAAAQPDTMLARSLDEAGVTGPLRRVLDRFLAGVLADSHGTSSANFTRLLLRAFSKGLPGLPEEGMQAIPAQLARELTDIRYDTPVRAVIAGPDPGVELDGGGRLSARHVVVATDPTTASRLAGLSPVRMRGLVTWWFDADPAPDDRPLVAVDGRHGPAGGPPGPVWNAAVVSAAAPSYAPAGRCLVQATTLLDRPDGDSPEADIRRHLGEIYQCETARWAVIARQRIPEALPVGSVPLRLTKPVAIRPGLFVCGDHRDTASLQGALVSGQRAARAVLGRT